MIMTAHRLRSMGWIAILVVCALLVMVLAFRVNALRSEVHRSQAQIIALKQETMYLETEFETRANQQQLKAWNDVDFGYAAPTATQYLDNERQLATFAKPAEPGAPAPVRVASADNAESTDSTDSAARARIIPAMVSPLTGNPVSGAGGAAAPAAARPHAVVGAAGARSSAHPAAVADLAGLGDHLATVHHAVQAPAARRPGMTKAVAQPPAGAHHADDRKGVNARAKPRLAAVEARGTPGAPLVKLALKDARAAK